MQDLLTEQDFRQSRVKVFKERAAHFIEEIKQEYGDDAFTLADAILTAFALYPGRDDEIAKLLADKVINGVIKLDATAPVPTFTYTAKNGTQRSLYSEISNRSWDTPKAEEIFYSKRLKRDVQLRQDPVARRILGIASYEHGFHPKTRAPSHRGDRIMPGYFLWTSLRTHLINAMIGTAEMVQKLSNVK